MGMRSTAALIDTLPSDTPDRAQVRVRPNRRLSGAPDAINSHLAQACAHSTIVRTAAAAIRNREYRRGHPCPPHAATDDVGSELLAWADDRTGCRIPCMSH